jgi:hypothetical protein
MWDVVDAFVDMMCLGDILTLEGGSIGLGGRWVQINCPADGECEVKDAPHRFSKLMPTYCQVWTQSDLYAVTKSIIHRLKRRHVDPASITLTLDLSPTQPWKRPIHWLLKDFDNARLVIKHDIYEIEVTPLNEPKAMFKILGAQILYYNLGQMTTQSQTHAIMYLLYRLFRKYKPHTRRKQPTNPQTIIQRILKNQP